MINEGAWKMKQLFFMVFIGLCTVVQAAVLDTVKINFGSNQGPMMYRGSGFLFGFSATSPADSDLAAIKPRLNRAGYSEIAAKYNRLVVLGCSAQVVLLWSGSCPSSWTDIENRATTLVNNLKANHIKAQIDIYNEPDFSAFWGGVSTQCLYDIWDHAYRAIRAADPTIPIAGPSCQIIKWYEGFLLHCKAANTVPDILTLHIGGLPVWVDTCYHQIKTFLDTNHINITRIQYNEMILQGEMGLAGYTTQYLAKIERNKYEAAAHACWPDEGTDNCYSNKLNGLLNKDGQRRGSWYAHKAYADITGTVALTTQGVLVDGIMGFDSTKKEIRGSFGRYSPSNSTTGDIVVSLRNISSTGFLSSAGNLFVQVQRYAHAGNLAVSSRLETVFNGSITYINNRADITVTGIANNDMFTLACTQGTATVPRVSKVTLLPHNTITEIYSIKGQLIERTKSLPKQTVSGLYIFVGKQGRNRVNTMLLMAL